MYLGPENEDLPPTKSHIVRKSNEDSVTQKEFWMSSPQSYV